MPVLSQLSKFAQHSVNLQDPPQTNALFIRNNYLGLSPHPSQTIKSSVSEDVFSVCRRI